MKKIGFANIFKSLFLILAMASIASFATQSYFNSNVSVAGNQFSIGTWETPIPTPTLTPSPIPTPTPLDLPIVINEVYYTPDASHRVNEQAGKNEWIELYNPTDQAVNIKDWQIITDNYSRFITANKNIPAHSFIMLSHDGSTWTFWTLPAGIDWADLGTAPNDYMRNDDSIKLKNSSDNLVDQFDYAGGQGGHSFERIPAGSATIVDQNVPTPGS